MSNVTKSESGATITIEGRQRCFKASVPATKTCDHFVATRMRDRHGRERWGILAYHGTVGQLLSKARPKADPRNRICCWLDDRGAKAADVLSRYVPSGDEARRLGADYGYYGTWDCDYDPTTGEFAIAFRNDRRGGMPEGIAKAALAAYDPA